MDQCVCWDIGEMCENMHNDEDNGSGDNNKSEKDEDGKEYNSVLDD